MTTPEQGGQLRQVAAPAPAAPTGAPAAAVPAAIGLHPFGVHGGAPLRRHAAGADTLGGTEVDPDVVGALRRRRGSGAELPDSVAGPLGEHFGQDLSGVRVHHDAEAGRIAGSLQATAFTHGDDIYFAPGAYRPGDAGGQHVLAHELSHVVAQRTGADRGGSGPLRVGAVDDPAEAAADRSAGAAVAALRRSAVPPVSTSYDVSPGSGDVAPPAPHLRRSAAPPVTDPGSAPADPERVPIRRWVLSWLWGGSQSDTDPQDTAPTANTATTPPASTAPGQQTGQQPGQQAGRQATAPSRGAAWWATRLLSAPGGLIAAVIKERSAEATYVGGVRTDEDDEGDSVTSLERDDAIGRKTGIAVEGSGSLDGIRSAYEAAVEAYTQFGAETAIEAKLLRKLKYLEVEATGRSSVFGGIKATFEGKGEIGYEGVDLEAEGELGLGLATEHTTEITLDIPLGELSAEGTAKAELMAKLAGEAALKLDWTFQDVEATAKIEAFAGGLASTEGGLEYTLGGAKLFAMKGKASIGYGWGGEAGFSFTYRDGTLAWDTSAFAANFLGGGLETSGELNVGELTSLITNAVTGAYIKYSRWLRSETGQDPRDPYADLTQADQAQRIAYDTYIGPLRHQAADRATGPLPRKPVQQLLNRHRDKLGDAARHSESDVGIIRALRDAYGARIKDVTVAAGRIGAWATS